VHHTCCNEDCSVGAAAVRPIWSFKFFRVTATGGWKSLSFRKAPSREELDPEIGEAGKWTPLG